MAHKCKLKIPCNKTLCREGDKVRIIKSKNLGYGNIEKIKSNGDLIARFNSLKTKVKSFKPSKLEKC